MGRKRPLTRGEKVCAFIEKYCRVPEGSRVGEPMKLLPFQRRFILDLYDNRHGTARAYLSIARKNGKTALTAAIVLAHVVGPEARRNSQIISGARSQKQAALVYRLAERMVRFSPELSRLIKATPSQKMLVGLPVNVEYTAISAEAGTAHGLSPVLAILDEVGQVRGPYDAFVEAIETAQGAHDDPLLIAISTQAPSDADLFSIWLDDAALGGDKRIVSHVYTAPEDCELSDRKAWKAANPALGVFRSLQDMKDQCAKAERIPTSEQAFRWLCLNQRVTAEAPFISRTIWQSCGAPVIEAFDDLPVYAGLDLSSVSDLTALVRVAPVDGVWHVKPTFWLPGEGLAEKSRADRVPYDTWHTQGFLETTPGREIRYEYIAEWLRALHERNPFQAIAFDRWNYRHLKPWLLQAGFRDDEVEGDAAIFREFGQGYASMSPALRELEAAILGGRLAHGNHPVLSMCAANAVVDADPAGNRKLAKNRAIGRIDGMIALAMAMAMAATHEDVPQPKYQMLVVG